MYPCGWMRCDNLGVLFLYLDLLENISRSFLIGFQLNAEFVVVIINLFIKISCKIHSSFQMLKFLTLNFSLLGLACNYIISTLHEWGLSITVCLDVCTCCSVIFRQKTNLFAQLSWN